MELVRNFTALNKGDAHLAGGKGASLGEMTQAGIPVPPGFVVLSESFEQFLRETDLVQEIDAILHKVKHGEIHTVDAASENIRALILSKNMPKDIADKIRCFFGELDTKYVAVRSSATAEDGMDHAWAGQLESYLNTTEEDLLTKVKLCWSSLFTPRAIFYRFEKGLHTTKISVAVVVQKMVESDFSGIAFSVHPVTEDRNQLIIEAGFGLGEAIVSGAVTPDSYVVEKEPRNILDINISTQGKGLFRSENNTEEHGNNEWKDIQEPKASSQVLMKDQILELSEIILKVENHYGFPCDIEWAYEGGKFYIVQSRPITTLKNLDQGKGLRKYEKTYTRECSLITMEIWEGQYDTLKEKLGTTRDVPFTIYDTYDGVVDVYFDKEVFDVWYKLVADKAESDKNWTTSMMEWYANNLDKLEKIWKVGEVDNVAELEAFYQLATASWAGLGTSYVLPEMKTVRQEDRDLAMALRERSQNFLEDTDHVVQNTLKKLYPELGELIKFVTLKEVKNNTILDSVELIERKNHYIYYGFEVVTKMDFPKFIKKENILVETESIPDNTSELKGQVAMKGCAKGKVRILRKKSEISTLQEGEVLVTAMTTPDYLPAMHKAVAFITDEGGITCHAAIVSRELGKPCIIGTKIATKILKDGDVVEVDANKGIIKILSSTSSFEPTKIEWHKLMERKNLFFVGLAFTDIESKEFGKIIGFDLQNFLFKFEKGNWSTYKSNKEFEELYKYISNLIRSGDQRFIGLARRGVEHNEEGGRYINEHSLKPTQTTLENFDKEYALYCNILLYGVTIPWDVIGAIETMDKEEQSNYKDILDAFEQLRAVSLYPDFEREVLQKYRDELSKNHDIDIALLNLLTPQELRNAVKDDFLPEEDILKKRYNYCVFWYNPMNDQIDFTFDNSIDQKIPALQKIKVESTDTIKGTIAYRGIVKGRVRIIYEPQDCALFKSGEILVSPSTNPSLMAAIQKCAGIVTDEGGMTSHAAIIARELKKPAVIGTKVATQLLNDGDTVEVDAEKGIVTIIK